MKHVDEYRDGSLALVLAQKIARAAHSQRQYRLMEFCGGHTHAISRFGVTDLLPANVDMIHGPAATSHPYHWAAFQLTGDWK